MNRMDVSIVFQDGDTPNMEFKMFSNRNKKGCSVWISGHEKGLDLIFQNHQDLAKLIRTLERAYKEGSKQHDD